MAQRYDLPDDVLEAQVRFADELNSSNEDPEDYETEEHPEGAKRGGYVPVAYKHDDERVRVFWDSTDGVWVPYDA